MAMMRPCSSCVPGSSDQREHHLVRVDHLPVGLQTERALDDVDHGGHVGAARCDDVVLGEEEEVDRHARHDRRTGGRPPRSIRYPRRISTGRHEELDRDVTLLAGALRTAIAELAGGHVTSIVDRAVADAAAARRAGTVAAVGRTRVRHRGPGARRPDAAGARARPRAAPREPGRAGASPAPPPRRDDGTPLPESIADAVSRLREGGVADTEIVRAARDDVHLELVLTAHPTEAARRTFLQSQLHLAELLHELDAPYLSATRRSDIASAIAEEATILWLSDDVRSIRPTVDDEIRQGLWFFEKSLLRAAAELAGEWHRNLPGTPPPLAFRTWIGGDQDGNPNAGPDDVLRALARSRSLLVRALPHEVRELSRALGLSVALAGVVRALAASIEADEEELPWVHADVGVRNATEPYRRKLTAIWRRLDNELAGRDEPVYADAAELQRDLDLDRRQPARQPRRPHRRRTPGGAAAHGRDLRPAPRAARPAHARRRRPRRHAAGARHDRRRRGQAAIDRLIISGTSSLDDIAAAHDLVAGTGLTVTPLFETLADLAEAPRDRRPRADRRAAAAAAGDRDGRLLRTPPRTPAS